MRPLLRKMLSHMLLVGSLGSLLAGCSDSALLDLTQSSDFLILPESTDQTIPFESLKDRTDFQTGKSIDHLEAFSSAWIRYEISDSSSFERPSLMLGLCGSIDKVGWGDQLLADFKVKNNFSLDLTKGMKPYLLLSPHDGPQYLYLRVLRSHRTGFQPDCRELRIGSEAAIVKEFVVFQALETMTGVIMLFLAALSACLWLFRRHKLILLFCLFSATIGSTFFTVSHPVQFALPGITWILHLWNLSVLLVPTSFLAFFYLLLPVRIELLRILAWANLIPVLIAIILYSCGFETSLEKLRMIFFQLLGPQIALTIALSIRFLLRAAFPASILAIGLVVLFLGAAIDVGCFLLNLPYYQATCMGLILFTGFLLTYMIQLYIEKERQLDSDRTQNLENYSVKLAHEVQQRSQVLHVKTEELEQSNFDLEEKNILLSMSHKRLEDLISQKDALLKKVAEISRDILPGLVASLKQLYEDRDKASLQNLSVEVHKISSQLEPVARLHSSSEALKSSNIWLLEPEKQLLLVTKMALGGSRVEIKSFLNPEEFNLALTQKQPDLAVISTDFLEVPQLLHHQYPKVDTVLTSRQELSHHINLLANHPSLCHVIYQDEEERTFTQKNLLITVTKILSNDIFGLEKYLNWGVDVKEYIITSSHNRSQFLEIVESELTKAGILTSHIRNATLITDEILMNAIYDAPVNRKTGISKYNHLSRRVMVELEPTEYGKLRFAFDGSTIALSVDDPFGALKRETITRYLKSCFDGDFGKINEHEGKGGGGMGLFQIISTADLMITNIKPSERTEIIALINVSGKSQAKKRHGSFHYFVEK